MDDFTLHSSVRSPPAAATDWLQVIYDFLLLLLLPSSVRDEEDDKSNTALRAHLGSSRALITRSIPACCCCCCCCWLRYEKEKKKKTRFQQVEREADITIRRRRRRRCSGKWGLNCAGGWVVVMRSNAILFCLTLCHHHHRNALHCTAFAAVQLFVRRLRPGTAGD